MVCEFLALFMPPQDPLRTSARSPHLCVSFFPLAGTVISIEWAFRLSPFTLRTSWTCGSIVSDDDHRSFSHSPRSAVSYHSVDAGVLGKGELGKWTQGLGGLV